jgi:hypothetical protein
MADYGTSRGSFNQSSIVTIKEVLREYNIDFAEAGENHHARANWLAIRVCPFCGSQNYHLGFNLTSHFFNCWKCRGHGVVSTLVRLGVPYEEAKTFSKDQDYLPAEKSIDRTKLVEPRGRLPLMPVHKKYLQGRHFDPETLIRLWQLEGLGKDGGHLSWRIYIPIILRGQRVSWTTRAIGETPQRYLSAAPEEESLNHKHTIYGLDDCGQSIVVVEGPADAWNVGLGAGCLFGVAYSPAQVLRLSRIPYRYICFDSSPEAQRSARELAEELAPFPGETTVVELDAEDPGKASRKEIKLLRQMANLD